MGGNTAIEDMILMSLCDHNIIANSSFSWWAAWLGETSESIIITPDPWFGPEGPKDVHDLIPSRWEKIKWN